MSAAVPAAPHASIARLDALAQTAIRALAWLPPLLTRLAIGHAFYLTGGGKLAHPENVLAFFTELGIPAPALNAWFVSHLEFYGGLLLVVGLGTRVIATMLAGSMVVALLTADKATFLAAVAGSGDAGPTDVTAFVYLLFLLWLALAGPGLVSLDALLRRLLRLPVPGAAPAPLA
jgi:putative oxidoreductase